MKKLFGALLFMVLAVMLIPVVQNSVDTYDDASTIENVVIDSVSSTINELNSDNFSVMTIGESISTGDICNNIKPDTSYVISYPDEYEGLDYIMIQQKYFSGVTSGGEIELTDPLSTSNNRFYYTFTTDDDTECLWFGFSIVDIDDLIDGTIDSSVNGIMLERGVLPSDYVEFSTYELSFEYQDDYTIDSVYFDGVLGVEGVDWDDVTSDTVSIDISSLTANIGTEMVVNYSYTMDMPTGVDGLMDVILIIFVIGIVVGGVAYIKFN